MGACELSNEPSCGERVFVSESCVERTIEPLLSLCTRSQGIGKVKNEVVALGIEGESMKNDCSVSLVCAENVQASIETVDLGWVGLGERVDEGVNQIDDTRNDDDDVYGSLPLRRSCRSRKTVQQVQKGKRGTRKAKKGFKDLLPGPIDLLREASRKKRSCYSRSICSSSWGTLERLSKFFQRSNVVDVNHVMDQRSGKKKGGEGRGKKDEVKVVETLITLEEKKEISHRPIRLKVTFGKKQESGKGESISTVQLSEPNKDVCSELGKSSCDDSSRVEFEKRDDFAAKFSDIGTSPDSEVIDQVVDSIIGSTALPSLLNILEKESNKSKNRRNKKDKVCRTNVLALECQHSADKAKMSKEDGQLQKSSVNFCSGDNTNTNSKIHARDASGSDNLLPCASTQEKKNSKGSKTKAKSRKKAKSSDEITSQRDSFSQQNSKNKLICERKVRETGISDDTYKIRDRPGTGNLETVELSKSEFNKEVALENTSSLDRIRRLAWVCCDDCLKWRCIPAVLADAIEATNSRWICKDNQDKSFADCSIPQEKSNAEINAELQISDDEDAHEGLGSKGSGLKQVLVSASQPSTWMLIKSNLFLNRSRKAHTMDEIMVCHCKPPRDGSPGCGSHCLNRLLNIECVKGTCPCGDLCSNQQFQRQKYAKLSWFRCGKKGYGLQVLEEIPEGQFLIEYVGEVLDLQTYEARQKEYASKGHKHYYFMTLNGNEVIDASTKGNVGRFVNHSCDPNCRTEKWVVNGEICVGLFALRSIKKGEELTFDYNYVRVFGAAVKKCHCGSLKCRGYIGGDPLNAEVVVQEDSDEEFPEPVVINEHGVIDHNIRDIMAKASSEIVVEAREIINKKEPSIKESGPIPSVLGKGLNDEVHEATDSSPVKCHISSTEHTIGTPTSSPKSDVMHVENASHKSRSGSTDSPCMLSEVETECGPHTKSHFPVKNSRSSKSVKNRKSVGKVLPPTEIPKVLSCKSKRLLEGSANGHLKDVEKKLNELLDADGGICKKKDASKGYLKLLLLTAASGDSGNGGAIQSNRILSMILDAMLKTKSRGVLLDIINKNGLQMLHNMMKLYRRDFKKIPISRKLLKVLEFLAEKELLTVERINVDSLHPGVESFRESILYFTEHDDIQVHRIARSFRDRWIPNARRYHRSEKDRWREFRRVSNPSRHLGSSHHLREKASMADEPLTCSKQSESMSNLADARSEEDSSPQLTNDLTMAKRPRKRKSRWDQPPSPEKIRNTSKVNNSGGGERTLISESKKEENNLMHNTDDEAPPGFSSILCPPSLGLLQTRFNPQLPVSYGIPLSLVQKLGIPRGGPVDSWAVAPTMPFQPYPPLPPYPCDKRQRNGEEIREEYHSHGGGQGQPCTSIASQTTVGADQDMLERGPRSFLGKRRHWQKNWNGSKRRPPWLRNIDGWGFRGNHARYPRNGSSDINMDMVRYEQSGADVADVNHSVEYAGTSS